jgi:SAM-dependent methyltransferase
MPDLRAALRFSATSIDGLDAWPWPAVASQAPIAPGDASSWVTRAVDEGVTTLVLEGGEPLREPGWQRFVGRARDAGLQVELATTGRLLVYPAVAARVARSGVRLLHVPLFSAEAARHDALVRVPGAHAQVLEGLAVLREQPGCPALALRSWLDARTLDDLPALAGLARRLGAARLDLRLTPYAAHRPAPQALRSSLQKILAEAHGAELAVTLADLPVCWAGDDDLSPFLSDPAPARYGVGPEPRFAPPTRVAAHVPACAWCSFAELCPGLPHGSEPAMALPRARAIPNCFELQAVAHAPAPAQGCARDAFEGPLDPDRHLVLARQGNAWLLEADGGWFSRPRLTETRERGLLYVNVSDRAHLDDFRIQLRRLRRSPSCDGCVRPCPGAFEEAPEPVLVREEAEVTRVLEGLAGDVLDVGFGPDYHGELFARLHDAGRIRYAGLEPEAADFERLARRRPDLAWACTTLEHLDPGERRFDAVLLLRSWNHLVDLPAATKKLQALLKPGGRLVVVDNVRFGYHLPASVVRDADGRFEHYRNHDLPEAEEVLTTIGFHVVTRVPLASGGDNQWMLVAEWPAS